MKNKRQQAILDIITAKPVETQEELQELLAGEGFSVTQATISRDIRELSLIKVSHGSGHRYGAAPRQKLGDHLPALLLEGVISVAAAQNMVVVKTLPGLAMAACTALDDRKISGNVGSLAGDDTIFLVMTDNQKAEDFVQDMEELLG